jgi:pyruvate/2-oxoacid:ferredoxin oxidoreductase alpha subunit
MNRVEDVYLQAQDEFHQVFGRQVAGPIEPYRADDADTLLLTSGSITNTARTAVDEARESGRRIGLLKIKMFRPFPREQLMRLCKQAKRIGVLDRNYSPGSGGIFWQEVRATLQGNGDGVVQSYLIGLCGMDVTSTLVHEVIDDLYGRKERGDAQWVGLT